jgi:hypothetical protein
VMRRVDAEAAARLLCGAALNAALWVAAHHEPQSVLPKALEAFRMMVEGFLSERSQPARKTDPQSASNIDPFVVGNG